MPDDYKYLLPRPDAETAGYWEGTKAHELRIQQCSSCGKLQHPPQKVCSKCQSESSTWKTVSGRGKVYTWIQVVQPVLPQWRDAGEYNIVQVQIDEDPSVRITGNVVDVAEEQLKVGLPVQVVFDDVAEDVSIPRWKPA